MTKHNDERTHQSTVHRPGKPARSVKNLGWLLRNSRDVERFELRRGWLPGSGELVARLSGGCTFRTTFRSAGIMFAWLARPVFLSLPATIHGMPTTIEKSWKQLGDRVPEVVEREWETILRAARRDVFSDDPSVAAKAEAEIKRAMAALSQLWQERADERRAKRDAAFLRMTE